MSINNGINKYIMMSSHKGILNSHENKWSITSYNILMNFIDIMLSKKKKYVLMIEFICFPKQAKLIGTIRCEDKGHLRGWG